MAGKVGRPAGIIKDKRMFGYKYTEKECDEMKKALEKYKEKHHCTTSKALYILVTECNK